MDLSTQRSGTDCHSISINECSRFTRDYGMACLISDWLIQFATNVRSGGAWKGVGAWTSHVREGLRQTKDVAEEITSQGKVRSADWWTKSFELSGQWE